MGVNWCSPDGQVKVVYGHVWVYRHDLSYERGRWGCNNGGLMLDACLGDKYGVLWGGA